MMEDDVTKLRNFFTPHTREKTVQRELVGVCVCVCVCVYLSLCVRLSLCVFVSVCDLTRKSLIHELSGLLDTTLDAVPLYFQVSSLDSGASGAEPTRSGRSLC
jgi:hypothetical protein